MHHVLQIVTWVVTSISNVWSESVSDKEIFGRSCSLNEVLWEKNDSIITAGGFLMSGYLENIGALLNISAFRKGSWTISERKSGNCFS